MSKVSDYISNIKDTSEANGSLLDLIKRGIVPSDTTLKSAIDTIMNGVINGENSSIISLDSHFETYARLFTEDSGSLYKLMDGYDDSIADIKKYWSDSYENPASLVEELSTSIKTKVIGVKNEEGLFDIND